MRSHRVGAPLSVAEKLAILDQIIVMPSQQALPKPVGVVTKAVLTPLQPFLLNQASILHANSYEGIYADGTPRNLNEADWFLDGEKARLEMEFIPSTAGQLTIIVFYIAPLIHAAFTVNGVQIEQNDGKIVFALTPMTTEPVTITLMHTGAGQMTAISSVEVFVAK